jgi:hypothetical protein
MGSTRALQWALLGFAVLGLGAAFGVSFHTEVNRVSIPLQGGGYVTNQHTVYPLAVTGAAFAVLSGLCLLSIALLHVRGGGRDDEGRGGKFSQVEVALLNGEELQRHHKQPRGMGGTDAYGNRELVHLYCHQQRHAQLRQERRAAAGDVSVGL